MATFKKIAWQGLFTQYERGLRQYDKDMLAVLEEMTSNLESLLNSGLNLGENFDHESLSYTSNVAANTEDTIAHRLGRIPTGFLVIDIDKGGVVYRGTTTWTDTDIYLKCTTGTTALKVIVF